jgi:hypothetical protein
VNSDPFGPNQRWPLWVAVATQLLVFPWFGLPARLVENLAIGGIFTVVSMARSYALRRVFEAIRVRRQRLISL